MLILEKGVGSRALPRRRHRRAVGRRWRSRSSPPSTTSIASSARRTTGPSCRTKNAGRDAARGRRRPTWSAPSRSAISWRRGVRRQRHPAARQRQHRRHQRAPHGWDACPRSSRSLGDIVKGYLARVALGAASAAATRPSTAAAAVAAVVGNCWSVFLGFRGGKGVATGLGALLRARAVGRAGRPLPSSLVVAATTRYVSLASLLAAVCVPARRARARLSRGRPWSRAWSCAGHRRVPPPRQHRAAAAGTEHRLGERRNAAAPSGIATMTVALARRRELGHRAGGPPRACAAPTCGSGRAMPEIVEAIARDAAGTRGTSPTSSCHRAVRGHGRHRRGRSTAARLRDRRGALGVRRARR